MRIFKSLLGVILAVILYFAIFTLTYGTAKLLQLLRDWCWVHGGEFYRILTKLIVGRGWLWGDWLVEPPRGLLFYLQEYTYNLLASGVGAYFSMIEVNKVLREYNKKIVFYGFSVVLILFTIYAIIFVTKYLGFGFYVFSVQILTLICAIGAAFFAIGKE